MAFIPANKGPKVGDNIVLKHEHTSCAGTFEVGTNVQIIGYGPRGYDIRDEFGNTMIECGWDL